MATATGAADGACRAREIMSRPAALGRLAFWLSISESLKVRIRPKSRQGLVNDIRGNLGPSTHMDDFPTIGH